MRWLIGQGCRSDVVLVTGYDPSYAKAAKDMAEVWSAMRVRILEKPMRLAALRAAIAGAHPAGHKADFTHS
jgi:hypothetical protein